MANELANEPIPKPSEVPVDGSTASLSSEKAVLDDKHPAWGDYKAGRSTYKRYKKTWDDSYLDTAVDAFQRAVNVAPEPNATLLGWLGLCLSGRHDTSGSLDDLERALAARQHALELVPEGHPDRALRLSVMASSLQKRFERLGELDDLELAIVMGHRRAVELTPDGHPFKHTYLNNLGNSLQSRFERLGELDDLEQAIVAQRRAVELTPEGHPDKLTRLNNLGGFLQSRFKCLGELDDLEQAIVAQRRAVELTPEGHPDKPTRLNNLGGFLQSRFEHLGELDDLEQAIVAQRRAVDLTPEGHPKKPIWLSNLGLSLQSRFERLGELDDLEQAIAAQRRAVGLTPGGHPSKPTRLSNLGGFLQCRFERLGELEDLEQAITAQQHAVELTPDGHPYKATRLGLLGTSLVAQLRQERTEYRFEQALSCIMTASTHLGASSSHRLINASNALCLLAKYTEFSTPGRLLSAHSLVIDILPEIVWLGHSIKRRFDESSTTGSLVASAVHAAIGVSALSQAVEWLEAGRSFVWSQIISFRNPLHELEQRHPDLAYRLRDVHAQLQSSTRTIVSDSDSVLATAENIPPARQPEADRHRASAIEYDKLLAQIRRQSEFEDFMKPRKFAALLPPITSLRGPAVFINMASEGCHAIMVLPHGMISAVPLPNLSLGKAQRMRTQWVAYLQQHHVRERQRMAIQREHRSMEISIVRILGRIWKWIVQPVLRELGLTKPSSGDHLPHITWCPTGPLTQIPLHAAGIYDEDYGPHTYDFAVSSYTPSLSTLTRSANALSKQCAPPSVLIVAQPDTPGLRLLPGTTVEGECLREVCLKSQIPCFTLDSDRASTSAVRAVLGQHSWIHLACHGSQNPTDPLRSAFALYDGRLSLADLMTTTADNAELAFLSACQTAVGDEKIPEESMHLAAGMLAVGFKGVIATMWSIRDDDAPLVVEAYYKKLLELRASGTLGRGETGAAYALHDATKRLREKVGEKEFVRWAPFVHFGI